MKKIFTYILLCILYSTGILTAWYYFGSADATLGATIGIIACILGGTGSLCLNVYGKKKTSASARKSDPHTILIYFLAGLFLRMGIPLFTAIFSIIFLEGYLSNSSLISILMVYFVFYPFSLTIETFLELPGKKSSDMEMRGTDTQET